MTYEKYFEKHFWKFDGKSSERIADGILNLLEIRDKTKNGI